MDDAIYLRSIRNIKLANQLLKVKKKKKLLRDQEIAQQNMEAQAQANSQQQQAAAQAEMQKNQAKIEAETQLETRKNDLKIQYLKEEVRMKKELMAFEFGLNSKMEEAKLGNANMMEHIREDRKDKRADKQAEHQSELAKSRNSGKSVKKFESSGNDIVTGGAGIDRF